MDFLLGIELAAGPVEVADSLPTAMARPTATVRQVSVSSQFAAPEGSPGGWGWAQQVYATLSGGAQWKVTGDVHGVPLDESGFASGAGYLNPLLLQTYGHDAPSSNVTLEATIVNADAIEILESVAVDYGAPIAHLLASHAPAEHPAHSSHASNGKAVAIEGGDLVLQSPGGPAIHLLGAGHIVQAR